MTKDMTPSEVKNFLLLNARTGKLATVRQDGRPHVAPVWFDLDGDTVVFTTWHETVKAANLRRDPRVAICVDDQTPRADLADGPYLFDDAGEQRSSSGAGDSGEVKTNPRFLRGLAPVLVGLPSGRCCHCEKVAPATDAAIWGWA